MRYRTVIFLMVLAAGCAKPPAESKYSWELYVSPGITADSFTGSSMAILPTVTITYDPLQQIYRETLAGLLYEALKKQKAGPKILPLDYVQSSINKAEMWAEYEKMIRDFDETSVLRKDTLQKLGRALGAKYVLLPKLLRFQQETFDRINVLGIAFLKTRQSTVDIHAQIWDVESGEVVWHGAGEGTLATEVVRGRPVSFMIVAQYACDSLVSRLPWAK
jgi:hypothetical protein